MRSNSIKLVSVKTTKNADQFQVEFSQMINTGGDSLSSNQMIGIFQEGNTNVNSPKERKAWQTVTSAFLKRVGIDVNSLLFDANGKAEVNIEEPIVNGMYFNIQLIECTESELPNYFKGDALAYKLANKQTTAKRIPSTKEYFMKNNEFVYSWGVVVGNKDANATVEHILIKDATKVAESVLFGVSNKITSSIVTE